jgi:hypothetical protein
MSETWEEPGGGVVVTLLPEQTIIVQRGRVDVADVVVDERGGGRPKRFRPREIGVRYEHTADGWSMEVVLGGPSVRADGRDGSNYVHVTYRPGGERPPFWAAAFAVAHQPVLAPGEDPEVTLTDEEIDGLPPEVDAP